MTRRERPGGRSSAGFRRSLLGFLVGVKDGRYLLVEFASGEANGLTRT